MIIDVADDEAEGRLKRDDFVCHCGSRFRSWHSRDLCLNWEGDARFKEFGER